MISIWRKIISGTTALSLSSVMAKAISFFSVIIITRVLSISDYGALTLALTVTGPVSFISGLGLETLINADIAKSLGKKDFSYSKQLIISFVRTKMIIVTALIILGWFFKSIVVTKFGISVEQYFLVVSLWVLVQALNTTAELILISHENFKAVALARIVEPALKLVGVILAWSTSSLSVLVLLGILVLAKSGALIFNTFYVKLTLNYFWNTPRDSSAALINILKAQGKWEIISQSFVGQFVGDGIRPWIIRYFLGLSGLGAIAFAGALYGAINQFLPINNIIFPILSRLTEDMDRARLVARKVTKYVFLMNGFIVLISFFAITPIIYIGFPNYQESIWPFRIYLIHLIINAISIAQPPFLYAFKLQKTTTLYSFFNVISSFSILPIMLIYLGNIGSLVERAVTMIVGSILRERLIRKAIGVATWRWKDLLIFDGYDHLVLNKIKNSFVLMFRKTDH